MRTIESAVRFGKEVLIENVLEELDPALDPILTKQTFTQNNQLVSNINFNFFYTILLLLFFGNILFTVKF